MPQRCTFIGVLFVFALWNPGAIGQAPASPAAPPAGTPAQVERKPVTLVIRVPDGSDLFVQGKKSQQSGTVRTFESPPLPVGRKYVYTLKATWQEGTEPRAVEQQVPVQGGDTTQVDLVLATLSPEERDLLDRSNQQRIQAGVTALALNLKLCRAARGHTANMARQNTLSHTLDGQEFWQRIAATGYQYREAAENIAEGAATPAAAVANWMASSGHKTNLLNDKFREIGLGIAISSEGKKYYTQVFASPLSAPK
jgi:uncharacterized protein (TIGR03000 family)